MTAEVAILNKFAVALAADSAVTIQYGNDVKIYNTLKLFSLCQSSSVGIMVYQDSEFMRVPWETIIKQYRKQLGPDTFPTLEEYGTDFIRYLNSSPQLFPEPVQDMVARSTVSGYLRLLIREIDEAIKNGTKNGKIATAAIKKITHEAITQWHDILNSQPYLSSLSAGLEEKVTKKYGDEFNKWIDNAFQPLPLTLQLRKRLRSLATFFLTKDLRDLPLSQAYSGVVIAGFGEADVYPAISTFRVESLVLNELRYAHVDDKSERITTSMLARVIAFAQEDVVAGFMEGIDREFHAGIYVQLSNMFDTYAVEVSKRIPGLRGKKQKEDWVTDLKKVGADLVKAFNQAMQDYKKGAHVQPIVRAVSVLPKEELASMAEALVNLTSTKRRVTLDKETVGGPIDVAVISKGDGFIWIKRKHYFEAATNPQFFTKYNH